MRLHDYARSSAAHRVRIGLLLKGIEFERVEHDLTAGEQRRPDYLETNPQGLVPSLEDEGEILVESLAILEYLDETCPYPPFLPGHPADRARVRALAQIIACDSHPLVTLRVRRRLAEAGLDPASVASWSRDWVAAGLDALETMLAGDERTGRFCHGDEPGLADICLVPHLGLARRVGLDLAPYETIRRIGAACARLDAFARAAPPEG